MKLRLSYLAIAFSGALGLVGCASAASSDVETDAAPTTVEGVIHIEQSTTGDATTTSVSAKFLRVLPEDAGRAISLVGSRVVTPHEGECASLASLSSVPAGLGRVERTRRALRDMHLKGSVELVDVGDLVLHASAPKAEAAKDPFEVQLTPRAFPDVGDLVSGVFYTQPDLTATAPSDLPSPGSYVLSGTGASLVQPFSIGVDAPATPANVRIGGQPFAGSKASAGRELTLEWDGASSESSGGEGLVYVDVQGASPYRCSFKDTGSAVLPSDVLSRQDAGRSVTVSLHRVREENVAFSRDESAIVRFDFSKSGRLVVE